MTTDDTARFGADDTQAAQYLEAGVAPEEDGATQPDDGGRVPPPLDPSPDPVDLALENSALARENAALKQAAQAQRIGKLVGELRFLGKLTPGLEQAGAVEILQAAYALSSAGIRDAGSHPARDSDGDTARDGRATVRLPDGTDLSFGEALANLLYAIPPSWGGEGYSSGGGFQPAETLRRRDGGATGMAGTARPTGEWEAPLPRRLSAQQREVARTLGLTPEEYAGITS